MAPGGAGVDRDGPPALCETIEANLLGLLSEEGRTIEGEVEDDEPKVEV